MGDPEKNLRDYSKRTSRSLGAVAETMPAELPDEDPDELDLEAEVAGEPDTPMKFVVPDDCAGNRLDQVVARLLPQYSRSRLQDWINGKQVKLGGEFVTCKQKVWGGESIEVYPQSHPAEQPYRAENIALDIVYEDETLLVINKPAGLVVHPGSGNWQGTLLNALLHHDRGLQAVPRAGIVHRLDKDTSGLLVVAKSLTAQTALVRQLAAHSVRREYLALVYGDPAFAGTIDAPIGRHPTQRVKMSVLDRGKRAVTHFQIEERFTTASDRENAGCTLLRCRLETGRTHQIRVHLAHRNHPLVGDHTYMKGPRKCIPQLREMLANFPRQALHAECLALVHPESGLDMEWRAPVPDDMRQLLVNIRAVLKPGPAPEDAA